ncbi:xanthine dehydrogenase small subunit [Acuticoccus sp. I52.16.1]|uniref:xanthine dehydrogenase small subunit n=1 Tax=Acuticoccus sp. I52.16.1 TaxID=2928472 RepID=UPI001FD2F638|nr:xanthine dehydrogenase small subunit [Acuticoccus sp. I52.16.1]UOM33391.1 xanthine dehydrogenase small subunit [Acuticoccus sp. I52.16.1]
MPASTAIAFTLNGAAHTVCDLAPTTTLLEYLRGRGLTGTKEGCAEGDCGSCTVAVRDSSGTMRAINACIMLLPMAHGTAITTVEGVENHPIQRQMADRHASQCGFCTPGFVMSLWARQPGEPADRQATTDRLAGNLCRCTGYGPILDAAEAAAAEVDGRPVPASPPPPAPGALDYTAGGRRYIAPTTEAALAEAIAAHPDATVLSGATDVGLWVTKQLFDPPTIVSTRNVADLSGIETRGDTLVVGAGVRLAAFARHVAETKGIAELMRRFGGLQVRNAGTVGGNIANGSPIGDLPPALIAAGATLELGHPGGRRTLPLEDYFIAYGKQDRRPGEYVRAVHVPLPGLARLACHKVSKRFDSDITAVLGCFALTLEGDTVVDARLAFGGMAATPKRARAAEAALTGAPYTAETVARAAAALGDDFAPLSDQRASAAYRLAVARNLLTRDFLERTAPGVATRLARAADVLEGEP